MANIELERPRVKSQNFSLYPRHFRIIDRVRISLYPDSNNNSAALRRIIEDHIDLKRQVSLLEAKVKQQQGRQEAA